MALTILDLLQEVLLMIGSHLIEDCCDFVTNFNFYVVVLVNKLFNQVFTPVLYERLEVSTNDTRQSLEAIEVEVLLPTFLRHPELARLVKTLDIQKLDDPAARDELLQYPICQQHNVDSVADALVDRMRDSLEELITDYPSEYTFLDREFPKLKYCHIEAGAYSNAWLEEQEEDAIPFDQPSESVIRSLLSYPELKTLSLDIPILSDEDDLQSVPAGSSTITKLRLSMAQIGSQAMIRLLRAPRALEEFRYATYQWTAGPIATFVTPTVFGMTLSQHMSSLRRLEIRNTLMMNTKDLEPLDLSGYFQLKYLKIPITLMLGYYCRHDSDSSLGSIKDDLLAFADLLPSSLKEMHLGVPPFLAGPHQQGWVELTIRSIAQSGNRLTDLKHIWLFDCTKESHEEHGTVLFTCDACDTEAYSYDGTDEDQNRDMNEIARHFAGLRETLVEVMSGLEVKLSVRVEESWFWFDIERRAGQVAWCFTSPSQTTY